MQRRTFFLYISLIVSSACSHSAAVTSPSSTTTDTTPIVAPSTLSGKVVDQTATTPIAAAALTLVDPAAVNPTLTTIADGTGAFAFANVAAGAYSLTVTAPGYTTQNATISVPVGALTLQMLKVGIQPSLPLTITIAGPSTLAVGQSSQLSASVVYTDGTRGDITGVAKWAATTASAGISATGLVTGYIPGPLVITASIEGVQGSLPLTVVPR